MNNYNPNNLHSTLSYIKDRYGLSVFADKKVIAMFSDLAPNLKKERNMLERMSKTGVLKDFVFYTSKSKQEQRNFLTKAKVQLTEQLYIIPDAAESYLDTLASVFEWNLETAGSNSNTTKRHFRYQGPAFYITLIVVILCIGGAVVLGVNNGSQTSETKKEEVIDINKESVSKKETKTNESSKKDETTEDSSKGENNNSVADKEKNNKKSDQEELTVLLIDYGFFQDGHGMASSDYVISDSDKRRLTENDLNQLTLKGINYAKNELYARHGRKFKSEELQVFFGSRDWYYGMLPAEPSSDRIIHEEFNSIEKYNSDLLAKTEASLGMYQLDQ